MMRRVLDWLGRLGMGGARTRPALACHYRPAPLAPGQHSLMARRCRALHGRRHAVQAPGK